MKRIQKIILSQLVKDSLTQRQEAQLWGGNYCYWSEENQNANDDEGKCSCWCDGFDYYDTTNGISAMAQFAKYD